MSSTKRRDGRAAGGRLRRLTFVPATLVPFLAAHAAAAELLGNIEKDLRGDNPVYAVPPDDRVKFRRSLAVFRAQLAAVPAAKKARVLGPLDAVAQHFRRQDC